MLTASARRASAVADETVLSRADLAHRGWRSWDVRRQIEAGRWIMVGRAVVRHQGPLTADDRREIALINCGPRSVLTSFTALEIQGLQGWTRSRVHVLTPAGARTPRVGVVPIRLHRTVDWDSVEYLPARRCHRAAPAAVLAASGFASPRPAIGLLAAIVQQRLTLPAELSRSVTAATRIRHRAALLRALDDIAMGAEALSEIDFVHLCRRNGLPRPVLQAVRIEPTGRRRYLDAQWDLPDGRRLGVEVDGAVHLAPARWFDDQLRQNELTLSGTTVLRFPSVIVRTEEFLVASQLRRAFEPT